MRPSLRAVFLAASAALAASTSAGAALAWRERARDAPLDIVGVCEGQESRWEEGSIFTYSDVAVRDVAHGSAGVARVTVRQPGGVADGLGQRVSHVTLLEPGRTYLLFLFPNRDSTWTPGSFGVNVVESAADGSESVAGESLSSILAAVGDAW